MRNICFAFAIWIVMVVAIEYLTSWISPRLIIRNSRIRDFFESIPLSWVKVWTWKSYFIFVFLDLILSIISMQVIPTKTGSLLSWINLNCCSGLVYFTSSLIYKIKMNHVLLSVKDMSYVLKFRENTFNYNPESLKNGGATLDTERD